MKNFLKAVLIFTGIVYMFGSSYVSAAGQSNHIVVNSTVGAVYELSYDEVQRKIADLAKNASTEDLWLYSDKMQKLYDVGRNGTALFCTPDYWIIHRDPSIVRNSSAVIVHNHPKSSDPYQIYPPSTNDFRMLNVWKSEFGEWLNCRLRTLVFDGVGVWEYNLTPEAIRRYGDAKERDRFEAKVNMLSRTLRCRARESGSRTQAIEKYIKEIGKLGVILQYRNL